MSLNLDSIPAIVNGYMSDTVRIYRVTGRAYNPATNQYTQIEQDLYTGPCFCSTSGTPQRSVGGMEPLTTVQHEIGIPISETADIKVEDFAVITVSKYDQKMVGKLMRVVGFSYSSFSVHRRIQATLEDKR